MKRRLDQCAWAAPAARVSVAAALGIVFWGLATLKLRAAGPYALGYDYTLHWWAGDALRRGYSPYAVINAWSPAYPFCSGYMYWLPTAVILEPLSRIPMQSAMPIFAGLSVAVFSYAVTATGWWRLWFIASAPLVYGALGGQVVPLVVAAILLPSLGWLAPMKYTLATAGFAYNLSKRFALLAAAVVVVSIVIWPWWPLQWYHELGDTNGGPFYHIPLLLPGGFVLLGALLKWRRPDARLLLVMACIPQTMLFYDQLPLLVLARNRTQALTMTVASYGAPALAIALHGVSANRAQLFAWNAPIIFCCYYLPALAIVLLRPNAEDESPVGQARVTPPSSLSDSRAARHGSAELLGR